VTTAPIPVEQLGNWLGDLLAALNNLDGQTADDESSTAVLDGATTVPSPFQPTSAKCLKTVAQTFPRSGSSHRSAAKPTPDFNNSPTARAAARLRDQIIHNLGTR
jgi:hypothetical protein